MQNLVVVGLQWGDEGKGKIVDYLSEHFDIVTRFQGGSNAGHTVKTGDSVFKFRIIPTGAVRGLQSVIGNGVVVDPVVLLSELEQLVSSGIQVKLLISERAQVITPYHLELDHLQESAKGDSKVGTTKRGIGPTYSYKIARTGIRFCDAIQGRASPQWTIFEASMRRQLENAYGSEVSPELESQMDTYFNAIQKLKRYMDDVGDYLSCVIERGDRVLFEGAQGALLDIDHGTYPFVTSSNCISAAAASGSGVSPFAINGVLGITKAYQTRVGSGPFPTELDNETGVMIRDAGNEFGTVTGRPRRCGWLDLVALRYAVRINGAEYLAVTKIDVLDNIDPLKVCVAYELDGQETRKFPADAQKLSEVIPVYEELKGWTSSDSLLTLEAMPTEMVTFLRRIESYAGARVGIASVGPDRNETLLLPGIIPNIPRHA